MQSKFNQCNIYGTGETISARSIRLCTDPSDLRHPLLQLAEYAIEPTVVYVNSSLWNFSYAVSEPSVGIDLKELGEGGQLPKCLKFCPGIAV